jgi:hypothetical protein
MLAGIALLAAVPAAVAVELYVSPEVPTTLGVPTYTPNQALRFDSGAGTYSVALSLPPSASIDALHRLGGPDWLVSFETPTTIGVVTYDPRDIVRTNGAVASVVLCGAAAGVPVGSNVDAVEQLGGPGSLLALSFDIPTTVGAFAVEPADLLIMRPVPPFGCGDYIPVGVLFDGSATAPPVPISSDLSAAAQRAGNLIFALDVPTSLGGPPVVPGQLTSWNGAAFAPFLSLAGWPSRTIVNALAFPTDPGDVRDDTGPASDRRVGDPFDVVSELLVGGRGLRHLRRRARHLVQPHAGRLLRRLRRSDRGHRHDQRQSLLSRRPPQRERRGIVRAELRRRGAARRNGPVHSDPGRRHVPVVEGRMKR